MHFRSWRRTIVTLPFLLLLMFALAACGGDDDDDSGGDDNGNGGGNGGNGSDEEFVDELCAAFLKFNNDITGALDDIDLAEASEDEIADAFVDPFKQLAEDFGDANPPDNLEDWHGDASEELNQVVEDFEDGNFDALEDADNPFPEPPEDAAARIEELAADNEDCQEAQFTFGE